MIKASYPLEYIGLGLRLGATGVSLDADNLIRSHLRIAETGVSLDPRYSQLWANATSCLAGVVDLRLDTAATKQRGDAVSCLADLFGLVGSLSNRMGVDTMHSVFDRLVVVDVALHRGQQLSRQIVHHEPVLGFSRRFIQDLISSTRSSSSSIITKAFCVAGDQEANLFLRALLEVKSLYQAFIKMQMTTGLKPPKTYSLCHMLVEPSSVASRILLF